MTNVRRRGAALRRPPGRQVASGGGGVIVDLFCGAGGAARGMIAAGVPARSIVGVDLNPRCRRNYPGHFVCGDAVAPPLDLGGAAFVWCSPPCQAYIQCLSPVQRGRHPDLVARLRDLLLAAGVAWWVIENVPGAPIRPDLVLTGPMVGLPIIERRRHFETSWPLSALTPSPAPAPPFSSGRRITVTRSLSAPDHFYPRKRLGLPGCVTRAEALAAMGLDPCANETWTRQEIANAVPPPYAVEVLRHARAAGWEAAA